MPLLRKQPFVRRPPARDLRPDDEVFLCEATKEVFRDYDEFFQRTILCNSLVWSCAVTGKANLTYEEAVECERKATKRLLAMPRPLKRALFWLAGKTKRGRLTDLVDDVYVFAYNRFFVGEVVEAVIKDQWCDSKILRVIPPTAEEIAKDAQEEAEELEKERKEAEARGESPPKKAKEKKAFSPPDHLFKYEVLEVEPDDPEINEVVVVDAEDIRREKGTYTREKNLLILKNFVDLNKEGNFCIKPNLRQKYKLDEMSFAEIFAGPEPQFEETKRLKGYGSSSSLTAKRKLDDKGGKNRGKGGKQGTLDSWVKGEKTGSSKPNKSKKQSAAELEEEMRRLKENNAKFKEEMKKRAEEARKKRLEDKAKEKERKKEERKLLGELMNEWNKLRDDLECDDLKEMPTPKAIHCKVPNQLFGDFLVLLEFLRNFGDLLELENSFPKGVTFELLQGALTDCSGVNNDLYEILQFFLYVLFDLQDEEDDEVKLDKAPVNIDNLDKNILGKDEDIANQIKSATVVSQWSVKTQGQKLRDLHMDAMSITEILRLHLAAAGAYRSDKLSLWLYQQRGGYKLSDDPGLNFRMEEPQILEALSSKTVFELSVHEKLKILHCLMYQILSFASVRDVLDERYMELGEARLELRGHQIAENKRQKAREEVEKQKRKEMRMQKKEEDLKTQENKAGEKVAKKEDVLTDAHLTERQRLAIQSQKEKEEKMKQKEEEARRDEARRGEQRILEKIGELQASCGIVFLGRDRAYRRFWALETLPGLFVEHDDDTVGPCLSAPTPVDPNAGPMDEETAMKKVTQILDARNQRSPDEKSSSDKENDQADENKVMEVTKTYSKKTGSATPVLKQKVLSAKNGTLDVDSASGSSQSPNPALKIEREESSAVKSEVKADPGEEEQTKQTNLPWGACLADTVNCPVHSTILPRTHWSYFSNVDELDSLIDALNPRGFREHELKEKLVVERDRLAKNFRKFVSMEVEDKLNSDDSPDKDTKVSNEGESSIASSADLQLRDQILELEEKLYIGSLGTLKVQDRLKWQKAIQEGGYDRQCPSLAWGGKSVQDTPFESRLQSAGTSRDQSRSGSPEPGNKRDSTGSNSSTAEREQKKKIQDLACAILQLAQMVDPKFFKSPLGEDEKEKKKRLKKEEDKKRKEKEEEESEDKPTPKILTPLENWENSLMTCTSYAQLFIHLTSLENSITWSKSLLNTRCRICRRKNDPDSMLLCDGCDRGHHTYCLKPKLKSIPEGDWYCNECKPKKRVMSPKKKTRRVFSQVEDDEEERVHDDDEEDADETREESDEEETQSGDEEEEEGNEEDDNVGEEEEPVDMNGQDEENDEESDDPDLTDDDVPLKRTKRKRDVEPAPKKQKSGSSSGMVNGQDKGNSSSGPVISQLLGKRRCAAQANERIARVSHDLQTHSGQSSGSENEPPASRGTRQSARAAAKRSLETNIQEKVVAAAAALSNESSARAKRRRAVDDKIDSIFSPTVLEDLLNAMMRHKDGWPFDRPITKADAPDYHQIIKRPMDLGTIRSSIMRMRYQCNQEVIHDIELVFENCRKYNREDAEEYQCGLRLEKYFRKEAKKLNLLERDVNDEESRPPKKARKTF